MSTAFMRAVVLAALALPGAAHAQLVDENLLVTVPDGYKIDFRDRKGDMLINEMVPQNESVDGWTEMVTVQIFYGLKTEPAQMRDSIAKGWMRACPGGAQQPVVDTTENGYPVLIWLLTCPNNPTTAKPEWAWFKAMRGNDSLYLVQKAFRFAPSSEQIGTWMRYLKTVAVCDSRLPERACPATK